MHFDLLIKDGTIIDGTGKQRFRGDVGVEGGRIKDVAVSGLGNATAKTVITAAGKFITPGFIDLTSHADKNWSLFQNPAQDYLLMQGVTTILVGNCGASLAPLPSSEDAVAALRKWTHLSDVTINWLSVAEFLTELEKHRPGVNVATLIGHGTMRRGILKGAARPLSADELDQFVFLVKQGISDGAFGLSTGLAYSHEAPATHQELITLARAVAEGGGVYKTHTRHEGWDLVPAINETLEIGRESKAPVIISHLKAVGRKVWPSFSNALGMLQRANENGLRFHFDISPYQRTGSFLYLLLPQWAREGGFEAMCKRIEAADTRGQIIEELRAETLHPDRYLVASSAIMGTNGKTIREVAERMQQPPEEAILELLLANRGQVTIFGKTLSSKNIEAGLTHPLGVVASNGSGISAELVQSGTLVHPRSSGTFPHFLHRFVKEKGLMTWEQGIRKITSLPAELVGFRERGTLAKGCHADIAVFDPERFRDRSTYENPYVHPEGMDAVIVNGILAVENGQLTGAASGQVLKKTSY